MHKNIELTFWPNSISLVGYPNRSFCIQSLKTMGSFVLSYMLRTNRKTESHSLETDTHRQTRMNALLQSSATAVSSAWVNTYPIIYIYIYIYIGYIYILLLLRIKCSSRLRCCWQRRSIHYRAWRMVYAVHRHHSQLSSHGRCHLSSRHCLSSTTSNFISTHFITQSKAFCTISRHSPTSYTLTLLHCYLLLVSVLYHANATHAARDHTLRE